MIGNEPNHERENEMGLGGYRSKWDMVDYDKENERLTARVHPPSMTELAKQRENRQVEDEIKLAAILYERLAAMPKKIDTMNCFTCGAILTRDEWEELAYSNTPCPHCGDSVEGDGD